MNMHMCVQMLMICMLDALAQVVSCARATHCTCGYSSTRTYVHALCVHFCIRIHMQVHLSTSAKDIGIHVYVWISIVHEFQRAQSSTTKG
jgi:hypothetical protein